MPEGLRGPGGLCATGVGAGAPLNVQVGGWCSLPIISFVLLSYGPKLLFESKVNTIRSLPLEEAVVGFSPS